MKYLPFLALCAFLVACDKDDKKEPTRTEHLTASTWKYDNGGIDQDRNGTIDITFAAAGVPPACTLDNTATFNANNTGIADEGATKCQASAPQTSPFNWQFTNNEQNIQLSGSGGLFGIGGNFKITALNATQFGLQKDTVISGFNVSMIVNLKH